MLKSNVMVDDMQLAMMGFTPCPDADLVSKVRLGFGADHTVLNLGEEEHLFCRAGDSYFIYVRKLS